MNFFGLEIKRARKKQNKLIRALLPPNNYGKELDHEQDFASLLDAYRSWGYIASSRNATAVASQPLRLYVAKDSKTKIRGYKTREVDLNKFKYFQSGKSPSTNSIPSVKKAVQIEEVLEHPSLNLFHSVNPFMNQFTFLEMTSLHLDLTGNSYWYVIKNSLGVPQEIWPVMPHHLKIIPHKTKFISGYEYVGGTSEFYYRDADGIEWLGGTRMDSGIKFKENEIVHHKYPSPKSLYYGYSPIWAVKDAYNSGQNIWQYEGNIFKNGGRLEGIFTTEEEIGDDEFERMKTEINDVWWGLQNVGKAALLDKGLTFKSTNASPKDMSYLQGRKHIKEEIINCLGQSLGMYDKDATRANSDTALYAFMRDAIKPRLLRIEQKINEKIMPMYDDGLFVAFDDPVPEDRQAALEERKVNVLTGLTSINEERINMNKKPYDNRFDQPLIPVNLTTIDNIISGNQQNQSGSSQGGGNSGISTDESQKDLSSLIEIED